MEPKAKLIDWQRLIITTLLVVVASVVTSSITWFILDRTFNESQATNAELITDLEKKITYLNETLADADTDTVEETGTITGTIMYPSEGIPTDIEIFAIDTTTGDIQEAVVTYSDPGEDMSATASYVITVPAGTYYVYGTVDAVTDTNGDVWKSYYNQYVVCGMSTSCTDTTKIAVAVAANEETENITIGDWYPTK